jgi:hypothetical protein
MVVHLCVVCLFVFHFVGGGGGALRERIPEGFVSYRRGVEN